MPSSVSVDLSSVALAVISDFYQRGKALPWRSNPPVPYHVWLSEIMLQQTRIEAVIPYFLRFIEKAPDIISLASLSEAELFKLWEGLGYYSRAANLQKTAKILVQKHGGALPRDYEALLSLPGIGPYTAGAISSIAFGLPTPAVDGNVLRFLARLTLYEDNILADKSKKYFTEMLKSVYLGKDVAALTQGLMEIGQYVCLPKNPRCELCPVANHCLAHREKRTNALPVRLAKKTRKKEDLTVFLIYDRAERLALQKRPKSGLLANLYGLPTTSGTLCEQELPEALALYGISRFDLLWKTSAVHIFTHAEWHMTGYALRVEALPSDWIGATKEELSSIYALPTAFKKLIPEEFL